MSMFSEYLHQLIQNRAVSISKLSRDSGVERTAIHKALANERILSYRAVELLIFHLRLSPDESHKFRCYYNQLFESENARQARYIVDKIFLRLSDFTTFLPKDLEWFQEIALQDSFWEKSTFNGYGDISRLLRFLIGEELKCRKPKLELAVPANVLAIQDCIERLYLGKARIEISHIMCFDASEKADEYNLRNLECLGGSLPGCIFSNQQYHIYYYYNEFLHTKYTDPLPYFLVTHAGAVCFSENCRTAIYLKEKGQIDYFRTCFSHLRQSCHKLMEYTEKDMLELRGREGQKEYCSIAARPCNLKAVMGKGSILFPGKSVSKFLETGALHDPFAGTDEVIPESGRFRLLSNFLEEVSGGGLKGKIINEIRFTFPDDFLLLMSANLCILVHGKEEVRKICFQERSLCHALYDWGVHFSDGDCVFDKVETGQIMAETLQLWQKGRGKVRTVRGTD